MTRFSLRRSGILALAFAIAHVATAALVFPLQIHIALKVVFCTLIAASLVHALARHALLVTRNAVVSASITRRDAKISLRDGSHIDAVLLDTTYVTPLLAVLNLSIPGERFCRHVILVRDNVPEEDFRRLRVALKWARACERRTTNASGL